MGLIELEAQKVEANALMESQNYAKAAALYSAIVSQLHTTEKNGSRDNEVLSDGKRLCIACLNNLSMAYQKMGEHGQCIDSCSSSIELDRSNLKAYYRRALSYLALAKEEDQVGESGRKGAVMSEKWGLATADAEAILMVEGENPQAKALKNDIRKAKLDAETKRKYDLQSEGESLSRRTRKDKNNSNFKGFPTDPHARNPEVAHIPSVTEADIKKFTADEIERAQVDKKKADVERASESLEEFKDQQAEAYKKSSGYVYLNPNWDPVSITPSARDGEVSTMPSDLTDEKKPKTSFKDLLKKAKTSTGKREKISRLGSTDKSKKIVESDKVKGALEELQSAEDLAKNAVMSTLAMKEVVGVSRSKGSDRVKERLGKSGEIETVRSELKQVGDSSNAWDELASVEEMALKQVRERLSKKNK